MDNTKTTRKKTRPKTTSRRSTKDKGLSANLKYEVVVLSFVALACLLIISIYFNLGGSMGTGLRYMMFGTFGIGAYLLPLYILAASFIKIFNKGNQRLNNKLALIFIAILVVSTLNHLYYIEDAQINKFNPSGSSFFAATAMYFRTSASGHMAGGLVGGVLGDLMEILVGRIGSMIVLVIVSLALIIMITEQSMAGVWKFIAKMGKGLGIGVFKVSKKGIEKTGQQIKIHSENYQKDREQKKEQQELLKKAKQKDMLTAATLMGDGKVTAEGDDILIGEEALKKKVYQGNKKDPFEQIIQQEEKELARERMMADQAGTQPVKEVQPVKEKPVPVEAIQTEIENVSARPIYKLPPIELMKINLNQGKHYSEEANNKKAEKLVQTLESFGVGTKLLNVTVGPTVTRYELQPDQGVKVSKIVNLQDDIALNLAANGIRIEAPIPGKSAVGIEVPNDITQAVTLREVIDTTEFRKFPSKICFALGKDISGQVMIADIARMPHLLIAGATGSGKSVCVNTLITSILYRANPDEVKMLMIDPKVVELSAYNGIPHLLIPVVTDPKKAAGALNWAVQEMADRYKLFAAANVRDLGGYNKAVVENNEGKKLPQIVIIVDELADLMMVAPNDVEDAICRLAQMARAAGLHLIIATQRPSVDVITGLIKANIPSRIAFNVSSGIDSRTIIDSNGAEKLLGKGDMLYYPVGLQKPVRVQGAFISEKEVENVVTFLKDQAKVVYNEKIMNQLAKTNEQTNSAADGDDYDAYFNEALELVIDKQKASASMIQRRFRVGYNRAARIVDQLHEAGFVGDEEGSKPRTVLMTKEAYARMKDESEQGTTDQQEEPKTEAPLSAEEQV
ncbi:MAG: cell division protein FtsK [Firmicutes bacterium HGW-Firmicutes-5]|nr:MAG: cell division protein FtsK [Firmicutes bacterium HGW-Firmicutes-5]